MNWPPTTTSIGPAGQRRMPRVVTLGEADAVVLEGVAEPDERVAAGEDSDAALQPARRKKLKSRQVVGETEARKDERVEIVEAGVVREAVALIEVRIEPGCRRRKSPAGRRGPSSARRSPPVVLQVRRVDGPLELRGGVVDVAGRREVAEGTRRHAADDVVREGAGRIRGKDAILEIGEVAEDQGARRVRTNRLKMSPRLTSTPSFSGGWRLVVGEPLNRSSLVLRSLADREMPGPPSTSRRRERIANCSDRRIVDADDDARDRVTPWASPPPNGSWRSWMSEWA